MNARTRYDVVTVLSVALVVAPFVLIVGMPNMNVERPAFATTVTVATLAVDAPPPVLPAIGVAPAVAAAPARREATPTTTPIDTRQATTTTVVLPDVYECAPYVNGLPYEWMNLEPARLAYRETARCIGWTPDVIARWEAFVVDDVIRLESGGCPNLRRGAVVDVWLGCILSLQGTREDSGFGQLVSLWWRGPGTVVCDRLGLCTSNAIISSGWNSMAALLVVVETDGRGPWCFNARARNLHAGCATVPRRWPS